MTSQQKILKMNKFAMTSQQKEQIEAMRWHTNKKNNL